MKKSIFILLLIVLSNTLKAQPFTGKDINPLRTVIGSDWSSINPSDYELNNYALSIYNDGKQGPFDKPYPAMLFSTPTGGFNMGVITTPGAMGGYGVGNFVMKAGRGLGVGPMNVFFDVNTWDEYNTSFWRFGGQQTNYKTLVVSNSDRVGIGTDNFPNTYPDINGDNYRLFVKGGIKAEEIKVELSTTGGWADYVFKKDYKLMNLSMLKKFIYKNKHLPNIPSSKTLVASGGVEVGKMMTLQQEKIEENTLYIIQLNEQLEKAKAENNELKKRLAAIEKLLNIAK